MHKKIFPPLFLFLIILLLAACGAAEELEEADSGAADSAAESPAESEAAAEAAPDSAGDISATSGEDDNGVPAPTPVPGAKAEPGRVEVSAALATADPSRADESGPGAQPDAATLNAGEIDDNLQWAAYLAYLDAYAGPAAIAVDVRERHQLLVQDSDGRPVADAQISLLTATGTLPVARTHGDGRTYFFPAAITRSAAGYTLQISYAAQQAALEIPAAGATREWLVTLPAPAPPPQPVPLDLLFLLDTTGSMADEIDQLKENIFTIAAAIDTLPAQPDVRFGMVTYRDRGDAYLTELVDFSADINGFASVLSQVVAGGGGDFAEDLHSGLRAAVQDAAWRPQPAVRLIFLIGDAPPHLDYGQEDHYAVQMLAAAARGIKIFTIASSGLDSQGEYIFRQLAQTTGAHFIFLTDEPAGSGSSGGETEFAVAEYTVAALDELVVRLVTAELAPFAR